MSQRFIYRKGSNGYRLRDFRSSSHHRPHHKVLQIDIFQVVKTISNKQSPKIASLHNLVEETIGRSLKQGHAP